MGARNGSSQEPGSPAARADAGRQARTRVPPASHAELPTDGRPGGVAVLTGQIPSRLPELVPIRHARMLTSPFAFYRGGAAIMAGDLARTPVSGFTAQLCGDAHLSNFGMFASPERALVFDINDFDETLPGPWEWDLKRLAASLVVAGRQNGFRRKEIRRTVVESVRAYRDAMAGFAAMSNLDVWYTRVDVALLRQRMARELGKRAGKRVDKGIAKARLRDHRHTLAKLTEVVDGERHIVDAPPLVVRVSSLVLEATADQIEDVVTGMVHSYASSLAPGYRELVRSYTFVDMARKVVGVGSVGTRCWIVLLRGRDDDDPLFLQVKEAQPSVLAAHLGPTTESNEGARVVAGQRIMQAAADAFLGWDRVAGIDGTSRDFYVRQLRDWKGAVEVERMAPEGMRLYGRLCAWTLARAHARSGDRIAIAAYLGDDDVLPQAVADFADAYADLNEHDFADFAAAVARGDLAAAEPTAVR
ncbi:DUF2252 domain-containing protein [Georgenia yuyongxinii]|uniref:DUF2252 domain-containing protein n=1 Tax=Georgenia yuyongxinii TaxID=2589797 RepID=A0A5B8C252_9MICO|nr:DUF2252 domain-containing protein [Georgenia yuyongxinii]QDC23342.1 DUF2252 domain-containing protein [Georgenia yuyongxinii]